MLGQLPRKLNAMQKMHNYIKNYVSQVVSRQSKGYFDVQCPGVNFINILLQAFMRTEPKSEKMTV